MLLNSPSLDAELATLAREDLTQARHKLKSHESEIVSGLIKPDPQGECSCIVEIRPGVGGGEAAIFANDLYNMYLAFCAHKRYKTSAISLTQSASNAISEVIFSIDQKGSYGLLNGEAGVHRVQRVPATESKGRVHTSTAAVHVLPLVVSKSTNQSVDTKDVRTEIMRSRGAGGQHVNTTDSAVRLTHIPTGISVSMQDSRSQHQNREKAWLVLNARLAEISKQEAKAADVATRRAQVGRLDRSEKIRTYNWAQNRVTDHRCNYTLYNLDQCMNGLALGELIEETQKWKQREAVMSLDVETVQD